MRIFILSLLLSGSLTTTAQKGCIKELPYPDQPEERLQNETDTITPIKTFRGDILRSGYQKGERVLNFSFRTSYGLQVELVDNHRPKLLIAGSYTCPVFRGKIAAIDSLRRKYYKDLDIYIIYVVEAHPNVDKCPYRDSIWITDANIKDSVLYPQPATYGARETLVYFMKQKMNIETTILLDNSNNDYWTHFGPAPNNAYLLDKDGFVVEKQGWFHESIAMAIDQLLAKGAAN
jgi:hypothetical protein